MNPDQVIAWLGSDAQFERYDFAPKEEITAEIPDWVAQSPVMPWVEQEIRGGNFWKHQVLALDAHKRGDHVAITTGTDSGKSLVPQISFLHGLMTDKDATYLVIPTLTALNRDQLARWERAFEILNLPPEWFARIDNTAPRNKRLTSMMGARLLFITPHSLHGWFMENLDDPDVYRILRHLRGGFLDEIQSYEDVMGANSAFLYRRLITLHKMLNAEQDIQWIAASGTIGRPKIFLQKLVGRDFTIIGAEQDGSRQNRRTVLHVQADSISQQFDRGIHLASEAVKNDLSGLILYFVDSRSGVEEIAETLQGRLGNNVAMPYSGKYSRGDVQEFDRRMRSGEVKIIVTTSALQSGIHLPNANLVINSGIPLWINNFFQRLGRSGRGDGDSTMALIGDRANFAYFATDEEQGLKAYLHTLPDNPPLDLDNQALGLIHMQCLLAERRRLGIDRPLPSAVSWPAGTKKLIRMAKSKRRELPPELQPLKLGKGRSPNTEFPLLNAGDRRCILVLDQGQNIVSRITEMSVDQALRECPPGGTFRYDGAHFFITRWNYTHSRFTKPSWHIRLAPSRSQAITRGLISQEVFANLHKGSVIQNHFLGHPSGRENGFIGEMNLQVFTKLVGLSGRFMTADVGYRGFKIMYRDLEREAEEDDRSDTSAYKNGHDDGEMVRRSNFFAQKIYKHTTGVIVYIPERWFGQDARTTLAETLLRSYMRARGIEVPDPWRVDNIGYDTDNVIVQQEVGRELKNGTLAIFDDIQCSLRLTGTIYRDFQMYLEDALREDTKFLTEEKRNHIQQVLNWYGALQRLPLPTPQQFVHGERLAPAPAGYSVAFAVGSIVDRERDGVRTSLKVVGYDCIDDSETGGKTLAYKLQAPHAADPSQSVTVSYDHAGNLVTRNNPKDAQTDRIVIVPEEQVQAPLNHVRFSHSWVNLKTLDVRTPELAAMEQVMASTALKNAIA